ncbi:TadE/TadG family type IV pilus assembly protein [Aureimonas sp. AU4]|uniref:TadE/TadG family type IV pilus assembly protein n=1 Tax=Aureimonas sp. AU4 TaxID=1638163 RepID=UPI000785CA4D|nr:TadE/TadG family type IV pilus assembly protein [Aureimonas sp. AU4]
MLRAPRPVRVARRFWRDRRAVAAVEFALILPVMLVFYLGTAELTQFLNADAKVAATADTVGNLVTRVKTIDTTSMNNIFAISSAVMNPFAIAPLAIKVTAVRVDANGKGTVHWSKVSGSATPDAAGATFTIPTGLSGFTDSYFVVSTATYAYRPVIGYGGIIGPVTLEKTALYRPRKSSEVTPQ